MSDGGYGDGYDAGFLEGARVWKAKALDFETKRDVAVSTLEKVKADRQAAKKALAAQCGETKKLRAQVLAQQARIAELETTPPDKREDLRCVISDLCHQVRERDARIVTQQAQIEELEAYNSTRTDELLAAGLQVAAQQARIEQLLEAVEYCCSQVQEFITVPGISKALSTPSDTSALEAIVKKAGEVMRERFCIAEAQGWLNKKFIRSIPAVTLDDLKGKSDDSRRIEQP